MILPKAKILNIDAKFSDGSTLKLQTANERKLLHDAICSYLKRTLTNEDIPTLQKSISAKVSQQMEFENFQFNSDQRIYELLVGETVLGIMQRTKSPGITIHFAWQKDNQQKLIQKITKSNSGSMDGAITIFTKDTEDIITLPIEAKSTMTKPGCSIDNDISTQALECIERKKEDFSTASQLSAILILPYSNEEQPRLDLKPIADKLQEVIADNSIAAICLLTVHATEIRITGCVIYGKNFQLNFQNLKNCMGVLKYNFNN